MAVKVGIPSYSPLTYKTINRVDNPTINRVGSPTINRIGSLVDVVGILGFIIAIFAGIVLGLEAESFFTFLTWCVVGFISWVLFRALAEIIYLLDAIRNNTRNGK